MAQRRQSTKGSSTNKRVPFPECASSRKKARCAKKTTVKRPAFSHDKDEDKTALKFRLRVKRLQRLLQRAAKAESAQLHCELGRLFISMGKLPVRFFRHVTAWHLPLESAAFKLTRENST